MGALQNIQAHVRDAFEARKYLAGLNDTLQAHWEKQGEAFYAQLSADYAGDTQACKMLEFLLCDLKDLKISYLNFMDRYDGLWQKPQARRFPVEFNDLARQIITRVKIEEEYLLPLIEKKSCR